MAGIVYDPKLPVAYVRGQIIPTGKRPVSSTEIMEGLRTELSADYDGDDPKLMGLTKMDAVNKVVIDKALDGDLSAVGIIYDRTMGKAVQQVQSIQVTANLKDFLTSLRGGMRDGHNSADSGRTPVTDPFSD